MQRARTDATCLCIELLSDAGNGKNFWRVSDDVVAGRGTGDGSGNQMKSIAFIILTLLAACGASGSVAGDGSRVRYDALLAFRGPRRLLEPLMQLLFSRIGDRAAAGMRRVLTP